MRSTITAVAWISSACAVGLTTDLCRQVGDGPLDDRSLAGAAVQIAHRAL